MSRRLLAILAGLALLGAGAFAVFTLTRPAPEPVAPMTTAARPRPAPAAPVERPPAAPAPVEPDPASSRRAAPAKPAAAVPDAAPVLSNAVSLAIAADVPGAQVFIDRRFIGEAPVTTTEVDPGTHTITMSAQGYEGISQSITVAPGSQQVTIKLREVRLNAKLEVVHKHRMGSCTGTLTATPQGLRYETTDKDDAFTSGLLDLESFEVDYLKKNLRIKPKKGKSFDFTDPAGNADHLFVFHRDVDKARARLQKGDPPASE